MKFSNKIISQTITQLCLLKGIDHVVISPGSRNAPLTIGFSESPLFTNFSIVDERSAAFFALGMAQQLKKPIVLVCTSGSALLNYYPAIAEAFYSNIPLIVISADRPAELIDIGDGQTIRQENVFDNHILYSANCKEGKKHQDYNERVINKALNSAFELQGPVHINIPFSEPLYETVDEIEMQFNNIPVSISLDDFSEDISSFVQQWTKSKKKMILIGVMDPNNIEHHYLDILAKDKSVIVLTETTSNIHHESFFPSIDQLIAPLEEDDFKDLQPDILLTFGGMVVSKKIKAFLRNYSPNQHWHVNSKNALNTYFVLKHHFKTSPNEFLRKFLLPSKIKEQKTEKNINSYQTNWLKIKEHRQNRHRSYEKEIPFSDFKVFSEIFKSIPMNIQLQLSNSTTIRYAQLFNLDTSLKVFCNRGTSGIDGCISTAIGAAQSSHHPTVLITGDIGFFYDSNALWNNYIPNDFKIIVINNKGGGIFRILPDAKKAKHFDTFFETKHNYTAEHICSMFGFKYSFANDELSLNIELNSLFEISEKPRLLEIFTPSNVNDKILLDYFTFIK